jgi:hypothetical protein
MTTALSPEAALAEWESQLALLDPGDVPQTYNAMAEFARRQSWLLGQIRTVRASQRTLAEVQPEIATLTEWRDKLTLVRQHLCDELFEVPSPARLAQDRAALRTLTLSIQTIDRGLRIVEGTGYALETLRLGAMMREMGYEEAPPTEGRAIGTLPWLGALPDVERRLEELEQRRADAQTRLDRALSDAIETGQQARPDRAP